MTFTQRRKIERERARLRVTRVHTLSPLSLSLSLSRAHVLCGISYERRNRETPMRNVLRKSSLFSLSLSRVFLLAFTSFVSFHNFVSSNARQITAATFLSRPWGTLPTLRYYNETRSRIRKMCIYVYILSELLPLHLPFSLFHFSTSSVGYFSTSSLLSFANFTPSNQNTGG